MSTPSRAVVTVPNVTEKAKSLLEYYEVVRTGGLISVFHFKDVPSLREIKSDFQKLKGLKPYIDWESLEEADRVLCRHIITRQLLNLNSPGPDDYHATLYKTLERTLDKYGLDAKKFLQEISAPQQRETLSRIFRESAMSSTRAVLSDLFTKVRMSEEDRTTLRDARARTSDRLNALLRPLDFNVVGAIIDRLERAGIDVDTHETVDGVMPLTLRFDKDLSREPA